MRLYKCFLEKIRKFELKKSGRGPVHSPYPQYSSTKNQPAVNFSSKELLQVIKESINDYKIVFVYSKQ